MVASGGVALPWLLNTALAGSVDARAADAHVQYLTEPMAGWVVVAYGLALLGPPLLSTGPWLRLGGILGMASWLAARAISMPGLPSLWCMAAAVLSALVLLHLRRRHPACPCRTRRTASRCDCGALCRSPRAARAQSTCYLTGTLGFVRNTALRRWAPWALVRTPCQVGRRCGRGGSHPPGRGEASEQEVSVMIRGLRSVFTATVSALMLVGATMVPSAATPPEQGFEIVKVCPTAGDPAACGIRLVDTLPHQLVGGRISYDDRVLTRDAVVPGDRPGDPDRADGRGPGPRADPLHR